jgi:hypothetical protein
MWLLPTRLARVGRVLREVSERMIMIMVTRVLGNESVKGKEIGRGNVRGKEKENAKDEDISRSCRYNNSNLRHNSNTRNWRRVLVMDRLRLHRLLHSSIVTSL